GRVGFAVAHGGDVDRAVTIEKHRRGSRHRAAMPSHLASCRARVGCDTRQCHTTAWNASESGVTALGSTVGITITSSPTFFVKPPSRPTTPKMLRPRALASSRPRTMLALTLRTASPPPTENTNTASLLLALLVRSQVAKTVSQPSSLVRAVSSETLS